ncbi:MAG: ATP-binding cassette domain-containing protein [Cryomorphaceae bacterium]
MAKDNGKSHLGRLFSLIKADRKDIVRIYMFAVLSGLINLSLPLGIQAIITYISGGMISTSWVLLVALVTLGIILAGVMQVMQLSLAETIQQRIFQRSSFEFAIRIPRIRLEQVASRYAPELINRFFDTLSLQKGLSKILLDVGASALQIIFGLTLLSFYHPFFILFGIALILTLYMVLQATGRKGLETSIEESTYKYRVAYWLEELARTMNTFKLAGESSLPVDRTDRLVSNYLKARKSHFRILVIQYMNVIGFKAMVAGGLLIIGSVLVLDNQINLGQFVATEIIIILIINSVEKLIRTMEPIYDVLTALDKIATITDLELERTGGVQLELPENRAPLSISVIDLNCGNDQLGNPLLNNISFDIAAGERVMIYGYSGSGRSRLLEILAGLYQDYQGVILYNDQPARSLELRSLRSHIGDSLNEEDIFEGTIAENILIGKNWVDFEDLKWAAEEIGLMDYIKRLPQGFHTQLSPKGSGFPEHIIRKIKVARSIVERPPLVIWQESLHLFTRADKKIVTSCMLSQAQPWTLIVSSGSKEIARQCDRIILLDQGTITFNGSYPALQKRPELLELFYE